MKIPHLVRFKLNIRHYIIPALIVISVITVLFSFCVGFYRISVHHIFNAVGALLNPDLDIPAQILTIVYNIRFPRVLAAFFIGAALSVSGTTYQGIFKNPLVSPDILGVSYGGGLGAAIAITLGLPAAIVQLSALAGGIVVVMLSYICSRRAHFGQTISLILIGLMFSTLCSAFITMLKYLADPNDTLPAIVFWLMGSLGKVTNSSLLFSLPFMASGFSIIFICRWRLNILSLGDDEAKSLGMNPIRWRLLIISGSTLLTASAVCLSGIIGWVGIMIPHMARGIIGSDSRRLIPISALLGGIYLLLVDNLCRSLSVAEIPIGLFTAITGVPLFLFLFLRKKTKLG